MPLAARRTTNASAPSFDAARQAELIRERYWTDGVFPVDPVTISDRMGIDVRETELPDDVSGMLVKRPEEDPVILLASRDSDRRKRFTCAHELGHYVYNVEVRSVSDRFEWVDFRNGESSTARLPEEVFANQFAANLLMPEDAVRRRRHKLKALWQLADYFGVSEEAASYRLRRLNLV